MAPNPNLPTGADNEVVVSPSVNGLTQEPVSFVTGHQEPEPTPILDKQLSLATLKKAYRSYKLRNKKGAAKIVLRYTRRGKPVY